MQFACLEGFCVKTKRVYCIWLLTRQDEFSRQMLKVREISSAREETVEGGWYTEEKMRVQLKYSPMLDEN